MSRLHVHLHVKDLAQSIRFYSALFAAEPTRREKGYAKWMLEDPRVNFAISAGGHEGVSHLGIQVDSDAELTAAEGRAREAAGTLLIERGARCCYARGDKAWAEDPQGVRWETFYTVEALDEPGRGAAETYLENSNEKLEASACGCAASSASEPCCAA